MLTPRAAASAALLAFLSGACATGRTVSIAEAAAECTAIRDRGIFNDETFACFPDVAAAVEKRLCTVGFRSHHQANFSGFGYGSTLFGSRLVSPAKEFRGFDRWTVAAWKVAHCRTTREQKALTWAAVVDLWGDLHTRLPPSLVGPWRTCWESATEVPRDGAGVRCLLTGSWDLGGEDGEIRFAAWNSPDAWLDAGARLRADLEVEGADCGGGEWPAGSRISSYNARELVCRRQGRSAVRVKLITGEGTCERRLPELNDRPWRDLCRPSGSPSSPTP